MINIKCDYCNKTFERKKSHIEPHNFCSRSCYGKWYSENHSGRDSVQYQRIEVQCNNCEEDLEIIPKRYKRYDKYFCNPDCHAEFKTKGNKTDLERSFGKNWQEQREKAIKRDNEECQICGMSRRKHKARFGKDISVDHIKARREFKENGKFNYKEANKLENLNTLCISCHRTTEFLRDQHTEKGVFNAR